MTGACARAPQRTRKTRGEHFEQFRKNYPIRREFRFTRVVLPQGHPRLEAKIRNLGFMI